jgi:hypothetical protein
MFAFLGGKEECAGGARDDRRSAHVHVEGSKHLRSRSLIRSGDALGDVGRHLDPVARHQAASANRADRLGSNGSREGLRAVGISLLVLGLTAAGQVLVYLLSGSVALLVDLIHNGGDAATAIPLGVAFLLRSPRAERIAGLLSWPPSASPPASPATKPSRA